MGCKKVEFHKRKFPYLYIISFVLLFLYPLRHVRLGVDLWDGGYNYANFYYSGLDYMDSMWYFATWISNVFGNFLTKLPGGDTMLGMNIYTSMVIGGIAVAAYAYCVKKMHMPAWLVFAGEILSLSLCWAPTAALYNYLTYGFLLGGTLLLYHGLTTGQKQYLVWAGVALGLNVGARFSNLVQMGLILAVWYYGFISKKKLAKVLQETFFCILGYVGAFGAFLLLMAVRYGFGDYVEGIMRLFAMTEHATDYTATSMLIGMVWAYYDSTYWLKRFALAGACALAICFLLPKKWVRVKQILTGLITLVLMVWLVKKGYCTGNFATYNSIYYPCIIIFVMAIGLSLLQIFSKEADKNEKLQAIFVVLMISLTSLGGNNAIYSSINNLFFVMPCFLWMAYRFLRERKHILYFPFKTILAASILLLFVQGVQFGSRFVYEEATGAMETGCEVVGIPALQGMYTGQEKAEQLIELYQYLQANELGGRECILYGNIPGIAYYMELAPAINIWSDLRSYSPETMLADLQELESEIAGGAEKPLVILDTEYAEYLKTQNTEGLPPEFTLYVTVAEKFEYICEFMERHGYVQDYSGEKYTVYR